MASPLSFDSQESLLHLEKEVSCGLVKIVPSFYYFLEVSLFIIDDWLRKGFFKLDCLRDNDESKISLFNLKERLELHKIYLVWLEDN